jgi:hypothetical protein
MLGGMKQQAGDGRGEAGSAHGPLIAERCGIRRAKLIDGGVECRRCALDEGRKRRRR